VLSRRQSWKVALVATLTMTVAYVDRATLAFLAPSVTKALDISDEGYGWLVSAFSFAYLFGTPFAGWWIDRVGARRGLFASVLAWSIVAALHAIVPGFGTLFVFRLLLGVTEGPGFPGAAQTIQRILPAGERERGFGVLFTGSSFGAMIVPVFCAWIYNLTGPENGWRVAFLVTSLAGLIWVPLWFAVTRSREVRAQLDNPPLSERRAGPGFVEMITHPTVLRALIAVFAVAPIFGFPAAWGAKYLTREFHLEQGEMGFQLLVPPLMFDAGAILFGDLASRQRRPEGVPPRMLFAIGVVLSVALAFLPLATTPWEAILITGVAVAGSGAAYTLITADLLSRMPPGSVSFAGGIMAVAQSLSFVIGNPIIGRVVGNHGNYDAINVAIGLWAIPGSLVWLLWRPVPIVAKGSGTAAPSLVT
jgi:MFS transporter, ACS family, hexuronate transporter